MRTSPSIQTLEAVMQSFREAKRVQESFLASIEKKTLLWLAARMPAWVNSDHLTLLGLMGMFSAGLCYVIARYHTCGGMLGVCLGLAVNWFGDSLDGTLARYRNCSRPRFGFYIDHIVDAFSALFLLGGLGLSGYMHWIIAIGLLVAFLMLSIEVYLATYTLGTFQISFYKFSPTELRILLAIGNIYVIYKPVVHFLGSEWRLFDIGGICGIIGMTGILLTSCFKNGRTLYRREPLNEPVTGERTQHGMSLRTTTQQF